MAKKIWTIDEIKILCKNTPAGIANSAEWQSVAKYTAQ